MAKGQVSEEQLSEGLRGIGDFGGLTPSRVRRDSPFRDSRKDEPRPEPAKTIEIRPATSNRVSDTGSADDALIAPRPPSKPKIPIHAKAAPKERGERKPKSVPGRKADIFTERVTLPISP